MTQILSLSVQNILGAESIGFSPNGQSVTIGGANGEGKSSAIWALVMALGGKGQIPEKPVHDGEEFGVVAIELDKFQVHLEISKDRKQKLIVTSADGAKYQSPQALLDKLFGGLSFDPGQFKEMDAAKRFDTLRNLVGLDLKDLKVKFEEVYTERRDVGREVKALEAKIAGQEVFSDAPGEEIDIAASMKELEELQAKNRAFGERRNEAKQLEALVALVPATQKKLLDSVDQLKKQIIALETQIEENEKGRADTAAKITAIYLELEKSDEFICRESAEKLHKTISEADSLNKKFRHNATIKTMQAELGVLNVAQAARDKKLEEIQAEKVSRLNAVKFPIEGLSIDGEVVLFNGIPFDQLSESEQWEVSTAIGFALNPKGIVFMKNCGGLDRKSRDRVRARAAVSGVQLFLEVVDDADDVQILIAEGKVLENRLA